MRRQHEEKANFIVSTTTSGSRYFRGETSAMRYYRSVAEGPKSGNLYSAWISARCSKCREFTVDPRLEYSVPCPNCGEAS
jgi:formylmethanofuran dehydrogenase subunit E